MSEFKQPFLGEVKPFKIGDKVERNNFIPLIIKSFNLTRGNVSAQVGFMEWYMANNGFDYIKTLDNYRYARESKILSQKEKDILVNSYKNSPRKHINSKENDSVILAVIDHEIIFNLSSRPSIKKAKDWFAEDNPNFTNLNWDNFLIFLNKKISGE